MKQTKHKTIMDLERLARVIWPTPDNVAVERAELADNGDFWVTYQLRHLLESHVEKIKKEEESLVKRLVEIRAELDAIDRALAPCPCL